MEDHKRKIQLSVCTVLIFLNLFFIWGNSMLPGQQSSEVSGGVMELLEEVLGDMGPEGEFVIRKMGHFSEFTCLGLLLAWLFQLFGQKHIHMVTMPLLCGSLAALLDETIQVFSPERGPSVIDVWIDTAGVTTGIAFFLLGCLLIKGRNYFTIGGNKT